MGLARSGTNDYLYARMSARNPLKKRGAWRFPRAGLVAGLVLCLAASCSGRDMDDSARLAKVLEMYEDSRRENFPLVPDITARAAMALAPDRVISIDVRTRAEREVSRIPGSVTPEEFLADPGAFAGRIVVAYCTISLRSGEFVESLHGRGLPRGAAVFNLRGGILAWVHAGGPLEDGRGRATMTLDVYGGRWDLAPRAYATVW